MTGRKRAEGNGEAARDDDEFDGDDDDRRDSRDEGYQLAGDDGDGGGSNWGGWLEVVGRVWEGNYEI